MKLYYFSNSVYDAAALHRRARHVGIIMDHPSHGLLKLELKKSWGENDFRFKPLKEYERGDTRSWKSHWSYYIGETDCEPEELIIVFRDWIKNNPRYHVTDENCRCAFSHIIKVLNENHHLKLSPELSGRGYFEKHPCDAIEKRILDDSPPFNTPKVIRHDPSMLVSASLFGGGGGGGGPDEMMDPDTYERLVFS